MVFLQWSHQIDDYNQKLCSSLVYHQSLKLCHSPREAELQFSSPRQWRQLMLSPQETLLGCISEMLGNFTNSTKMLEIGG